MEPVRRRALATRRRHHRFAAVAFAVAGLVGAVAVVALWLSGDTGTTSAAIGGSATGGVPAGPVVGVHVRGNRLVDASGTAVRMVGFNLSGGEYACIEGSGMFDTPDGAVPTDAQVAAIAGWQGARLVRVPLNEQCWLGIGGVDPQYGGANYRTAVQQLVTRLARHGLVSVLDLHRSAPGDGRSLAQEPMPDRDHSVAFWSSVAATFAGDPAVAFDLFNEPFPYGEKDSARAWTCWRDGGCSLTSSNTHQRYVAAGMQELVTAVRATGARNVIFAGGLHWAEGLTHWPAYAPVDPAGQLGASFHAYSFNDYCATTACYDRDLAPIAAKVPLLAGEVGPDLPPSITDFDRTCPSSEVGSSGFASGTLGWLDAHGAAWTTWAWTPTGDCWALASSWQGGATPVWGALVRTLLAGG